jgi:hypothetical protein
MTFEDLANTVVADVQTMAEVFVASKQEYGVVWTSIDGSRSATMSQDGTSAVHLRFKGPDVPEPSEWQLDDQGTARSIATKIAQHLGRPRGR